MTYLIFGLVLLSVTLAIGAAIVSRCRRKGPSYSAPNVHGFGRSTRRPAAPRPGDSSAPSSDFATGMMLGTVMSPGTPVTHTYGGEDKPVTHTYGGHSAHSSSSHDSSSSSSSDSGGSCGGCGGGGGD